MQEERRGQATFSQFPAGRFAGALDEIRQGNRVKPSSTPLPQAKLISEMNRSGNISEISLRSDVASRNQVSVAPAQDVVHNLNLPPCDRYF